ncbi:MAG: circadian clock KaiB family protein [Desulfovibrionales bacterium]
MTTNDPKNHAGDFERALEDQGLEYFVLQLFVTGATEKSMRAVEALRNICSEELEGRCEIQVIDILQNPGKAREDQIVVIPTLIKKLPQPIRRLIGDLSDKEQVLKGLGIIPKKKV